MDDKGRGGGLVVSVLAFYSDNPSSNPAGCLNFQYEKTKINEKRPGLHVHRAKAYGCQLDASIGTPATLQRLHGIKVWII